MIVELTEKEFEIVKKVLKESSTSFQIAYCEDVVKAWVAMYKRKTGANHFGWCYTKEEKESAIYALADLVEEDIGDKIDYSADPKVTAKQFYDEIEHLSEY